MALITDPTQNCGRNQIRAVLISGFILSFLSLSLVGYVIGSKSWNKLFEALSYNITLPGPTRVTMEVASFTRSSWWWLLCLFMLLSVTTWKGYLDRIAKGLMVMNVLFMLVLIVGGSIGMELAIGDLAAKLAPPSYK